MGIDVLQRLKRIAELLGMELWVRAEHVMSYSLSPMNQWGVNHVQQRKGDLGETSEAKIWIYRPEE